MSNSSDLPSFIKTKKALLNINNKDPYCFLRSVEVALFPYDKTNNPC